MFKLSKDIDYNPGHRCCATWYRIVAQFVAPEVEKINNDKNKLLSSSLAFFQAKFRYIPEDIKGTWIVMHLIFSF